MTEPNATFRQNTMHERAVTTLMVGQYHALSLDRKLSVNGAHAQTNGMGRPRAFFGRMPPPATRIRIRQERGFERSRVGFLAIVSKTPPCNAACTLGHFIRSNDEEPSEVMRFVTISMGRVTTIGLTLPFE